MTPKIVGQFEVLESLGAGGMGEVFKARDTRIGRFVALKFLPEAATDAARERFKREAQAVGALNHPHICTLYEIGEDGGRPYLVLELLEGETLKTRLRRGPVSPEQALDWGAQIADALDAAHRKGVLHRDLKPDNIWVGTSGHVKVLDFGLARLASDADASGDAATVDIILTSPGQTMGTIPYMSPEQAKGETLDARSDIFSFGSVFYEMAAGKPAFAARSAAEITAAILKEQPAKPSSVRADVPPMLDQVTDRCLEKDPDLRYQSAADLRGDLKRLKRETSSSSVAVAAAVAPTRKSVMRWLIPACAGVLALLAFWRFHAGPAAAPAPQLQFRQLTSSGNVVDAVISPDGKFLAHVDNSPQGTSLHLLSIVSGSDVQIMPPAPGCCQSPSFSPDGGSVYFLENRVLKSVPILGGALRTVAEVACSGAGFSPDGSQIAYVAATLPSDSVVLANADGSNPHALHQALADAGYASQCYGAPNSQTHSPAWSPDGRHIALAEFNTARIGHIEVISTADGQAQDLGPVTDATVRDVAWLPDGSGLIFTGSASSGGVPQVHSISYPGGQAMQLTNDLQGYASASISSAGVVALVHGAPQFSIWTQAKPDGTFQELPGGGSDLDGAQGLAWTPQGALDSLRVLNGKSQIWAESADGSTARQLSSSDRLAHANGIGVAANGQILTTITDKFWRLDADGGNPTELVHPAAGAHAGFPVPIRDGRDVAYLNLDAHNDQTLWTVPLAGGTLHPLWSGFVYVDGNPVSPDGAHIFVISRGRGTDSHVPMIVNLGTGAVTAAPVPGFDFKSMPGPYGWTADGKAITYVISRGTVDNVWAYPVAGGVPHPLTHFTDLSIGAYAMSHDGRLAISRGTPNSDAVLATGLGKHP